MRACETCKYKSTSPPQELLDTYREMARLYPRVYYCSRLQAVKVYDPSSPAKMFDCELYEQETT
jgi:hypothetical protein